MKATNKIKHKNIETTVGRVMKRAVVGIDFALFTPFSNATRQVPIKNYQLTKTMDGKLQKGAVDNSEIQKLERLKNYIRRITWAPTPGGHSF